MSNTVTRTAKRTTKKIGKKVAKSSLNYAKGYIVCGVLSWAFAALIALAKQYGIEIPEALSGYDTVAMVAFIIAGFVCFGRRLSAGRIIGLIRTFMK